MPRSPFAWFLAPLAALHLAACGGSSGDDDSAAGGDPPAGCDSAGLGNVSYWFEIEDLYYGAVWTVDDYIELLQYYGLPAYELSLPGEVGDQTDEGGERVLDIDIVDPYYGPIYSIHNHYSLPEGVEIPVERGDPLVWRAMINYRNDVLKLGAQFADESGCLLFYAEPGKRIGFTGSGLAYDNVDEFSQSRIFASVVPRDVDCPFTFQTDCGEQYNLALDFQVQDGASLRLFPGETAPAAFLETTDYGTCKGVYDVTAVLAYDWRDVDETCPDENGIYERDSSFFVLRTGD